MPTVKTVFQKYSTLFICWAVKHQNLSTWHWFKIQYWSENCQINFQKILISFRGQSIQQIWKCCNICPLHFVTFQTDSMVRMDLKRLIQYVNHPLLYNSNLTKYFNLIYILFYSKLIIELMSESGNWNGKLSNSLNGSTSLCTTFNTENVDLKIVNVIFWQISNTAFRHPLPFCHWFKISASFIVDKEGIAAFLTWKVNICKQTIC